MWTLGERTYREDYSGSAMATRSAANEGEIMEAINKDGAIHKIDLEALNQVNAEIRWRERQIDTNLIKKRQLDAERKKLRNELVDFHKKRRDIIEGSKQ
jgi:predicted metal-dependent RNase